MRVSRGIYSLVSGDPNNGEVFDFDKDVKNFIDPKDAFMGSVNIANIDRLTTLFSSDREFVSYLSKEHYERDTTDISTFIRYKSPSTGKNAFLRPVWNDKTLHKIASAAKDSKVDFRDETTYTTLLLIYDEITDKYSSFCNYAVNSTERNLKMCDHSKKILNIIHGKYNNDSFVNLVDSFESYREFRALYLSYKKYKDLQKEEKFDSSIKK